MSEMNESEISPLPDTSPPVATPDASPPVATPDASSPVVPPDTSPPVVPPVTSITTTNTIPVEDEVVQKPQAEPAPSNIKVGNILNADGLNIVTRCWQPEDTVNLRALLFICHGLAEHAARYDALAKAFADVGIMVFAHDHVGHGRSDGERAQISDFLIFSRDVIQHLTAIQNEYPNLPLFLFGHSMGSLIAVDVILQKQELFKGLILSGMALKPDPNLVGPTAIFFGKIVAWFAPSIKIKKLDPPGISRDENEVRKYAEDPLNYTEGIKAGIGANIIKRAEIVQPRLGEIHLPTLVFHGGDDTYTFVGNSHLLFNAIQSEDKQIKVWPGARHELHNEIEPDRTEIIQSYVTFVQERI